MLFFLLLVFLLITTPFWGTELKFNYQPAKNNLEDFPTEELKLILPQIRGIKDFQCRQGKCRIDLYPLLISYTLKGFSPFAKPKLEKFLGLKTFYRYPEETLASAANNIVFFLRNNGYLDASVKSILEINKKGYAKLKIVGSEGNLYIWGGFNFKGKKCFKPTNFYQKYNKPFGIPFSFINLYNAVDLAGDICKKKGFFESFVYYTEPFEVKKETLFHFFWRDLKTNPVWALNLLSRYVDILVDNPIRGIYLFFKPLNSVYPTLYIWAKGIPYRITFKGNKYFSTEYLNRLVEDILKKRGFLSPLELQKAIVNLYHSQGFFDVRIEILFFGKNLVVKISEGKRYKLKIEFHPPIKGFFLKPPTYYEKKYEFELLKELKTFLHSKGFLFKDIKIHTEIDRNKKVVILTVFIDGLRKVRIVLQKKIDIPNKSIRDLVIQILKKEKPYNLLLDKAKVKTLREKIKTLLDKFGCENPYADIEVKDLRTRVEIIEKVSCKRILKFGHTAFWIEGRIKRSELKYLLVDFYGRRFNRKLVDMLRNRIALSNLFESYTIKLVRNKKVIPLVEGVEKKPISLEGQVGFSSDEGYLMDLALKITDPFGFGSRFSIRYRLASKRTLYQLSYLDDYLLSAKTFGGANLFKKYEEHRDFNLSTKGYSITLGYHLNLYTDLAVSYISTLFGLDTLLTNTKSGRLEKISLSGELYYPIYRGLVRKGLLNAFFQLSEGINTFKFFKTSIGLDFSLFLKEIYTSLKISVGYVSSNAPIFEKFYLGGIKNLKGFSYESVAPPGGGDIYWYIGNEWGIPLFKPLYLFGGFDVGNCVKKGENPFGVIKKDIFVGVGGLTAAGPIRFVLAIPLKNRIQIQDFKYLFLIGFNF